MVNLPSIKLPNLYKAEQFVVFYSQTLDCFSDADDIREHLTTLSDIVDSFICNTPAASRIAMWPPVSILFPEIFVAKRVGIYPPSIIYETMYNLFNESGYSLAALCNVEVLDHVPRLRTALKFKGFIRTTNLH